MAVQTKLAQVLNGLVQNIDLTTDEFVFGSIKVGGGAGTILTKTILDNLIALQNGTDFANGTNSHTHDGRYFTETELSATSGTSGSDLIGDDDTYATATPSAATVKGALEGLDSEMANRIRKDGSVAFTADQSLGGFKITNLADPTAAQDAATKAYVDAARQGLDVKDSVRVASTGNLTLSGAQTIDGVSAIAGDRVLVKDQTTGSENGIYVVAAGAWSRSTDANTSAKITAGMFTFIEEGTVNADSGWVLSTNNPIVLNTTALTFAQFSGAGSITAGAGLLKTGNTIDLVSADSSLTVNADSVQVKRDPAGAITLDGGSAGLEVNVDGSTIEIATNALQVKDAGITAAKLAAAIAGAGLTGGAGAALAVGAGNGISVAADSVAVAADATGGANLAKAINVSSNGVAVKVDDSTIEGDSGTGQLRVKDAGITAAKLAAAVAGAGLTGGAGSALAVGAGDGISVAADSVAVNVSDLTGSGLENDGSNNLRIATGAYDQLTITGGSGSTAAVAYAPQAKKTMVAGEAFAANTSFLVRWALTGETAGRVYKATNAAATTDYKFWAIGLALSTGAVSAGGNIDVTLLGTHTLGSSDTAFNAADAGLAVWLTTAGGFSITAPTTSGAAAFKVGTVETTTKVWLSGPQLTGVA